MTSDRRCPRCRSPLKKRYLNHYGAPYAYVVYCEMCGYKAYGGADEVMDAKPKKEAAK
jgi:C4-type Zn-finger protein